ncbi:hypothetical protein Tco_1114202 [Tanacetum coccineum]|uniref:Uncharacterized protein n=1 Tax=Tanacetum coccineum TaxID=301880 RepID=A0ABQ5IUH7_9ASTR
MDGTLTRVMEKLDHMVKDFHLFEYNKGMETRKWKGNVQKITDHAFYLMELYRRKKRGENKGKVSTEMELVWNKPIKGSSLEVRVAVSSSLRLLEPKRTVESRAKRSSINPVRTQHPSETMVFYNEDGNPARANIKQALGRPHKGVKASANSNIMYFFTSAQDGDPLQDDVRLCLGDDLKKAQDHNQRQV